MRHRVHFIFLLWVLFINFILPLPLQAEEKTRLSDGQTIYVPAYSHTHDNRDNCVQVLTSLADQ